MDSCVPVVEVLFAPMRSGRCWLPAALLPCVGSRSGQKRALARLVCCAGPGRFSPRTRVARRIGDLERQKGVKVTAGVLPPLIF